MKHNGNGKIRGTDYIAGIQTTYCVGTSSAKTHASRQFEEKRTDFLHSQFRRIDSTVLKMLRTQPKCTRWKEEKKYVQCYLYQLLQNKNNRLQSAFVCLKCRTALKVNFFAAFQCGNSMGSVKEEVYDTVVTAQKKAAFNGMRKRTYYCIVFV